MKLVDHLINGKNAEFLNLSSTPIYNPATGEEISRVVSGTADCVDEAVKSALNIFPEWSSMTPLVRSRKMFKLKEIIELRQNELAKLISQEHGKTFDDALGEIGRGLEVVEFACGIPNHLAGNYTSNVGRSIDSWSDYQPMGVCAGITPFNFPIMVPMWMFPVAIACGNCFILKPSERDPSSSKLLCELVLEAGIPPGVLNMVNGGKDTVDAILQHKDISGVSFGGSTSIAHYVYSEAAKYGKKVQAMGGAKNHMVVMPDADVNKTTDAIIGSAFGSAGERCMAISVAVCVGKKTSENLKAKLLEETLKLNVGPYTDEKSDFGPLNNKAHYEKVLGYIDAGEKEGAKLLSDGRNMKLQGYENGYFVGPTIFDEVKPDMKIYKEEIFGPVLSMMTTDTYEDALKLVNDHELGNGAAVFTKSGMIAKHFTENAKIGMIGVNVPIPVPVAYHSFGGWKRSLFGDHSMHGPEGVRFYTKLKTATVTWSEDNSGPEFTIPVLS